MSVWSKNHADLVLLVKSLQAKNSATRQNLLKRRHSACKKETINESVLMGRTNAPTSHNIDNGTELQNNKQLMCGNHLTVSPAGKVFEFQSKLSQRDNTNAEHLASSMPERCRSSGNEPKTSPSHQEIAAVCIFDEHKKNRAERIDIHTVQINESNAQELAVPSQTRHSNAENPLVFVTNMDNKKISRSITTDQGIYPLKNDAVDAVVMDSRIIQRPSASLRKQNTQSCLHGDASDTALLDAGRLTSALVVMLNDNRKSACTSVSDSLLCSISSVSKSFDLNGLLLLHELERNTQKSLPEKYKKTKPSSCEPNVQTSFYSCRNSNSRSPRTRTLTTPTSSTPTFEFQTSGKTLVLPVTDGYCKISFCSEISECPASDAGSRAVVDVSFYNNVLPTVCSSDAMVSPRRKRSCETFLTFSAGLRVCSKIGQSDHSCQASSVQISRHPHESTRSWLQTLQGTERTCVHTLHTLWESNRHKDSDILSASEELTSAIPIKNRNFPIDNGLQDDETSLRPDPMGLCRYVATTAEDFDALRHESISDSGRVMPGIDSEGSCVGKAKVVLEPTTIADEVRSQEGNVSSVSCEKHCQDAKYHGYSAPANECIDIDCRKHHTYDPLGNRTGSNICNPTLVSSGTVTNKPYNKRTDSIPGYFSNQLSQGSVNTFLDRYNTMHELKSDLRVKVQMPVNPDHVRTFVSLGADKCSCVSSTGTNDSKLKLESFGDNITYKKNDVAAHTLISTFGATSPITSVATRANEDSHQHFYNRRLDRNTADDGKRSGRISMLERKNPSAPENLAGDLDTFATSEVTEMAPFCMLGMLDTLRMLRNKQQDGRSSATLLRRLEFYSNEYLAMKPSPKYLSIPNDLIRLCQILADRIESNNLVPGALKRSQHCMQPLWHRMPKRYYSPTYGNTIVFKKDRYYDFIKSDVFHGVLHSSSKALISREKINKCVSKGYQSPKEKLILPHTKYFSSINHVTGPRKTYGKSLTSDGSELKDCYVLGKIGQSQSKSSESSVSSKVSDMDSEAQLDQEFVKLLADMKPYVLKQSQKTERQKSAVWIKKLCESAAGDSSARKTRNTYALLLLQMLKKGSLSSPFDQKPEAGALKPLPSYLTDKLPDWVEGELADTVGSSIFSRSVGIPAATSTWVSNTAELLERPHSSMERISDKDPSLSPIRHTDFTQPRYSADDMSIELQRSPPASHRHHKAHHSPSGDREKRLLPDVKGKESRENDKQKEAAINDTDWSKPYSSTTSSIYSLPKGTTFFDEPSFLKPADREIAMRAKMIEAKFHEEKLKLQQKHDAAVQKILDRKNAEIEDVKALYKTKHKDLEDTIDKLERKVQSLMKEIEFVCQTKDKQISELKRIAEDSGETRRNEYENKLHEMLTEFEREKFELQKQHTQNIQEILDDTNDRLQRMEAEYTNQTNITTDVIKELESRVQKLMNEVDSSLNQRSAVEKEKNDILVKCEKLSSENERLKERIALQEREHQKAMETHQHEIKSLKNKTEASLEFLKQEHSLANSKAADIIRDLEEKVDHLKKSLKESEEHRQRQIREVEHNHQQDKSHLENLHDKQVRNLKKELEQLDADWRLKVTKLEQIVKEKELEIGKVKEQKHQQKIQAEQALEDFKSEIEKSQNKIYDEMKQQMQQVEIDLQKSKQAREKQSKEFNKQMEEEKHSHQHQLAELKMTYEADKSQLMREFHLQKEYLLSQHETDMENLKELHRTEVLALEARMKEKQDKAEKSIMDGERMIRELREELLQSNQLRKQQLVELGLLREEEKQKILRDNEAEISRMRGEMEQQRLNLQKAHSTEIENVLEKTNQRLASLEKDFAERAAKSSETITELQLMTKQLRDELQRCKENYEKKLAEMKEAHEEEKKNLKKKYSQNLESVKSELEAQKNRGNNAEKRLQKAEADLEERITELKIHYEEKMRGLVPLIVKKELEDTIVALKSQVTSLQLRSTLLQEELEGKNGLVTFGTHSNSTIKSSV